jgi:hypothetical protein
MWLFILSEHSPLGRWYTCHITEQTIPPDHFDVDENPDNQGKYKEVSKVIDALIVDCRLAKKTMDRVGLFLNFITKASLTVRLLPGSNWRIDGIILGSLSLYVIMKHSFPPEEKLRTL